jgi:hypothetical protein
MYKYPKYIAEHATPDDELNVQPLPTAVQPTASEGSDMPMHPHSRC